MKNVGDEAFRVVFPQFFDGHEIEFVTPPKLCNKPDIVVLGGGAVVSPFYLDTLPDCPRYALGVDIAYESEIDLLAPKGFREVCVRNSTDIEVMRRKLGCPVRPIPDLAFYLKPSGKDLMSRYKRYGLKPTLGVFITDYLNPAIDRPWEEFGIRAYLFKTELANQLDELSEIYEIMLVPCATDGYGDDRRINLDMKAYMKKEPTLIMDALSPNDMIDLMAQMDCTLCMRFHAHIFSVIAHKPFVSIDFTRKVNLFLKEHDLDYTKVCTFNKDKFELLDLKKKIAEVRQSDLPLRFQDCSHKYNEQLENLKESIRQEWLR
jgi:polysaccharide pyruvyl transferase WcaK-like protein